MQHTRLCAATIAILILGGCSGNADTPDRAATIDATTTTTGPPDSATTTSSPVDVDQAQLESVLLTIEDVPTGYATYTDPSPDDDTGFCDGHDPVVDHPELAKAEAQFSQGGETGPFLIEIVAAYSPDEAEAFMGSARDALNACQTYTEPNADGTTATITLSPISFPSFGDETLATRITVTSGVVSGVGDIVYVRNGNSVFYIATLGLGGNDTTVTEAMTRAAQAKIEAAT